MSPPSRLDGGSSAGSEPKVGGLLLFTKPAVAGRVKTRLVGAITAQQAADLHAAFLDDLLVRLGTPAPWELRLAWALDAGEPVPEGPPPGVRQVGADLGERLFQGLADASGDFALVVAIGSDHPDLPRARVEEAFAALAAGAEVVFGPATDGGYYLVGVRREALAPALFTDIPWSGPEVLARSLQRCGELGLTATLLPEASDVDTPADLARLAASLRRAADDCPRTAALLSAWEATP
jgi:rSAM/selenodomain-associated transferase 1